jgi:hypothetical protein
MLFWNNIYLCTIHWCLASIYLLMYRQQGEFRRLFFYFPCFHGLRSGQIFFCLGWCFTRILTKTVTDACFFVSMWMQRTLVVHTFWENSTIVLCMQLFICMHRVPGRDLCKQAKEVEVNCLRVRLILGFVWELYPSLVLYVDFRVFFGEIRLYIFESCVYNIPMYRHAHAWSVVVLTALLACAFCVGHWNQEYFVRV